MTPKFLSALLRSKLSATLLCLAACLGGALPARPQAYSAEKPLGLSAQQRPDYLAHAGIQQRLGQALPLDTTFTDEDGQSALLRSWFGGKPVVLALVYYKCAMLCPQVLHGLETGLRNTTLKLGANYDVLIFSIDPTDTPADAAQQKAEFVNVEGPGADASAVHFLTAAQPSIDAISAATGFHYVRVPGPDGKLDQFAHSSVIMFATPDGRLSKYLAGLDYQPRDIRMALLEASEKKISSPADLLILYCCSYNPAVGRYSVDVVRILGIAGMFALAIVIGMIFLLSRKPKSRTA